ncbi:MAG TPA: hydantoinase B/oxoprolinase family protein [Acidimicrobiales bacterium]|nr:hydantoinase B/oxoprolinase family protein [Acidimicrobiales bacterium]
MTEAGPRAAEIGRIRLEVIRNALTAIADEAGVALRRAAYSTNIKTRLDYSCALFDPALRTVAQAFTQPVHLGTLAHFVPRIVAAYGAERLEPGDALLCNDGHLGGIHLNDVALVAPAYSGSTLIGYVATMAHHVDVGGTTPGSIGLAREIFQEGVQIPPVRLCRAGELDEELLALLTRNVRSANETAGDLRAQLAGAKIGERRLAELACKHGETYLAAAEDAVLDYTERATRAMIRQKVPEGRYRAEGFLDDDGFSDVPVRIAVDIEVDDGSVRYDLRDCDPQRPASINTTYAMSFSACAYTLRALIGEADLSMNDGFYRCLVVTTEPGTVAHSVRPAAIGAGADVGARVLETALRAFAVRLPDRLPADSKGTMCNISFGGIDPRTGLTFTYYEAQAGGYGGRRGLDGINAVQPHMQNTENAPIEETEARYPVSIVRYELIRDSDGAGEFRGGLGLRRDYTFEGTVQFSVMADRAKLAPEGLAGGLDATPSRFLLDPDGETRSLGSKFSIEVEPGHVVSVQIGGGGGWGDPALRRGELVASDVDNGFVSASRARELYGFEPEGRSAGEPGAADPSSTTPEARAARAAGQALGAR